MYFLFLRGGLITTGMTVMYLFGFRGEDVNYVYDSCTFVWFQRGGLTHTLILVWQLYICLVSEGRTYTYTYTCMTVVHLFGFRGEDLQIHLYVYDSCTFVWFQRGGLTHTLILVWQLYICLVSEGRTYTYTYTCMTVVHLFGFRGEDLHIHLYVYDSCTFVWFQRGGLTNTLIRVWQLCILFVLEGRTYNYGYDVTSREHADHWRDAAYVIHPDDTLPYDGFVTVWHVYLSRPANLSLIVWRPYPVHPTEYRLVDYTNITVNSSGHHMIALTRRTRIPFLAGDVLGMYFPQKNPVPFSKRSSCHRNLLYLHNPCPFSRCRDFVFREQEPGWNPCRVYSISADIVQAGKYPVGLLLSNHIYFGDVYFS